MSDVNLCKALVKYLSLFTIAISVPLINRWLTEFSFKLDSVTRFGLFLKHIGDKLFYKSIPIKYGNYLGHFDSTSIWVKTDVAHFWGNLGYFYSTIWSHCLYNSKFPA